MEEIQDDLIREGRDNSYRVWRGYNNLDSSDDECVAEWITQMQHPRAQPQEKDDGIQVRKIFENLF